MVLHLKVRREPQSKNHGWQNATLIRIWIFGDVGRKDPMGIGGMYKITFIALADNNIKIYIVKL